MFLAWFIHNVLLMHISLFVGFGWNYSAVACTYIHVLSILVWCQATISWF
jgi:hypothetical protein